jgi:rhodanese-related sulfurtransferase
VLAKNGFERVYSLDGGLRAWKGPIEHGASDQAQVSGVGEGQ